MNNNKMRVLRYVSFVAALAIMIFIFSMSAQNSEQSANTSESFIRVIAPILNPQFESLSTAEQEAFVEGLQFYVRKGAHFSVYAVLGLCLAAGFLTVRFKKQYFCFVSAWGIGTVYAATDELHQHFVPGRSCELRDLCIDSCGVLLGCLAVVALYLILKRTKKQSC